MWKNRTFATACYADDGHALKDKSRNAAMRAVILLSLAFLLPSLSWGACRTGSQVAIVYCPYESCRVQSLEGCKINNKCDPLAVGEILNNNRVITGFSGSYFPCYTWDNWCGATARVEANTSYIQCDTQAEADSAAAEIQKQQCMENPDLPQCPKHTYHCQNSVGGNPNGYGGFNIADIYECLGDVCTRKQSLAGTCQDWGYCDNDSPDCDVTDSTHNVPCSLSGNGTSTNGKCYYFCGNGKNYTCPSKYSTWAGDHSETYIGQCDSYPDNSCAPDLYTADSSEVDNPYTGGGAVPMDTVIHDDSVEPSETDTQIDYSKILVAIHDTLTKSLQNHKAQTWYQWSIDSVLKNNIYYDMEQMKEYERGIYNTEMETFTLMSETGEDIRQARALLDSIKNYDTLNVRTEVETDTAYTNRADSIYNELKNQTNGFEKLRNWYSSLFGDSATIAQKNTDCSQFNSCLKSHDYTYCSSTLKTTMDDCLTGGTPFDTGLNLLDNIAGTLWDAVFGDDTVSVDIDTTLGDTSMIDKVQALLDSMHNFDIPSINIDSLQDIVDSLRNSDTTSVEINPDSIVTDTSVIREKFGQFMLPATTTSGCYTLNVNLGTLGGLVDEDLKIYIDFSDFGGYDFCELGRTIIRIMTLVVVISLTLGSWAAAFGWNKNTGD